MAMATGSSHFPGGRDEKRKTKENKSKGEERRSGLLSGAENGGFSFPFPFFLGLRMALHLARSFSLSYVKGDTKMNLNLFYGIERYRIQPSIYAVDRGRAERERESSGLPPALSSSVWKVDRVWISSRLFPTVSVFTLSCSVFRHDSVDKLQVGGTERGNCAGFYPLSLSIYLGILIIGIARYLFLESLWFYTSVITITLALPLLPFLTKQEKTSPAFSLPLRLSSHYLSLLLNCLSRLPSFLPFASQKKGKL
jgi:hypothetical protein